MDAKKVSVTTMDNLFTDKGVSLVKIFCAIYVFGYFKRRKKYNKTKQTPD